MRKLIVVAFALTFFACGDPVNVYELKMENEKPVVVGSENGLMWYMDDPENANTKLNMLTYSKAIAFCENMDHAGHSDWRLPTIDELRTVVFGYSDIEPGGRCKVGAECLRKACLYQNQKSTDDYPCSNKEELELLQGPGPEGCFFDDVWRDYCGYYWSASKLDGMVDENVFVMDFSDPAIFIASIETGSTSAFARCVRN